MGLDPARDHKVAEVCRVAVQPPSGDFNDTMCVLVDGFNNSVGSSFDWAGTIRHIGMSKMKYCVQYIVSRVSVFQVKSLFRVGTARSASLSILAHQHFYFVITNFRLLIPATLTATILLPMVSVIQL